MPPFFLFLTGSLGAFEHFFFFLNKKIDSLSKKVEIRE